MGDFPVMSECLPAILVCPEYDHKLTTQNAGTNDPQLLKRRITTNYSLSAYEYRSVTGHQWWHHPDILETCYVILLLSAIIAMAAGFEEESMSNTMFVVRACVFIDCR